MLDRRVNEFLDLRKRHNLVKFPFDLVLGHAEDGSVEEDVLPAGEFGMETGAHLQEAGDAALDVAFPGGGGGDAGEDLEEGAFPGTVAADDAKDFALLDFEGDIPEGPDVVVAVVVFFLADLQGGIGFAPEFGPGAVEVVLQGSRAHQAKTVVLGEVFNLNYDITHFSDCVHEGFFHPVKQENTKKKENQSCYSTIDKIGYAAGT